MQRSYLVLLLAALSTPALAEGPSYNFVEVAYQEVELDDSFVDVDGDGFALGASLELAETWHAFISYANTDFDFDVELDELAIGGGLHLPMTSTTDFVFNLAYLDAEASALGISVDDDGFGASVGLRSMLTEQFELAANLAYADLGDSDNEFSINGQAWYSFTDNFAVGLNVGASDDILRYGVGGRIYFGN